ncbi:MAG: methyltransferase domain-containing protein [Dehalococcoidales bacterium]|nr:MAG: methyltransferase domain-containing protein [Dehalococcoidales bacterium]
MPEELHDLSQGWNSLAAELLFAHNPNGLPAEELAFYERRIRENGGKALEHGCGTGRRLFPLLAQGLDVHGADISADGLRFARKEAVTRKVQPVLYHQRMEECDIPHKYGTIYCDSFQVIADRHQALTTLQRFWQHLVPDGQLLLELFVPREVTQGMDCNDADHPRRWRDMLLRDSEGEVKTIMWSESVDLFEQVLLSKRRYDVYIDGKCIRSETHAHWLRWYFHYEFIMMLENTGFDSITTYGDYTDNPATQDSKTVVYGARRPRVS